MQRPDVSSPATWAGLYTLNTRPAVAGPPPPAMSMSQAVTEAAANGGVPVRIEPPMGLMDAPSGAVVAAAYAALPFWKRVLAQILLAIAHRVRRLDKAFSRKKAPGGDDGQPVIRIVSGGEKRDER